MNRTQYDEHAHRMITWARLYARRGWPVFPCAPFAKVPALSRKQGGRGCLDATTNLKTVEAMWARFPTANIGLATGGPAGLAVLDADVKTGGKDSLKALVAQHGNLPSAPVARTTSGGRHYFYNAPPGGINNSAGRLGPGLDVRGNGGYVVAAPSITPAGAYEWLGNWAIDLEDWPEWLIPPRIEPTPVRNPQALVVADADKVLAGLIRTVLDAGEGARNEKLFWAGCRLGEHATNGRISLDEGAAALLDAAARIGLTEHEANRTLHSALRKVSAAA